jgi:hypothetical protein
MKTKLIALATALLAFTNAVAATTTGITTFDIRAYGDNGTELSMLGGFYNSYFYATGEKTNVTTTYHESFWLDPSGGYTARYLLHHYDIEGYYQDWYKTTYYSMEPYVLTSSLLVNATVSLDPTAAARLSGPGKLQLDITIAGEYSGDGKPYLARAASHNSADLAEVALRKEYDSEGGVGYRAGITTPFQVDSQDFQLSITGGPEAANNFYMFVFNSATYDYGIHHRVDYESLPPITTPVPEPTTWAMLLAGVGILGVARRRKSAA